MERLKIEIYIQNIILIPKPKNWTNVFFLILHLNSKWLFPRWWGSVFAMHRVQSRLALWWISWLRGKKNIKKLLSSSILFLWDTVKLILNTNMRFWSISNKLLLKATFWEICFFSSHTDPVRSFYTVTVSLPTHTGFGSCWYLNLESFKQIWLKISKDSYFEL